jgi:Domain of unknown function (DUF5667)
MISQLLHRRRAERLARLLEQADGGPGLHSRSSLDGGLAAEVAIGQRLATLELSSATIPAPAFRAELRAMLVATAEREQLERRPVAPAQRRPVGGRIYADASPGSGTAGASPKRRPVAGTRRTRIAILAGFAAGTLAVSGISVASGDAMPGDPLYGMKRSAEGAQLVLAGSDVDRGVAYLGFARTRAREADATSGDPDRLIPVLSELDQQTTAGVRLLTSAALAHHNAATLDPVDSFVAVQRPVLTAVVDAVGQRDVPRAQQSLDLLNQVAARSAELRRTIACTADGRSDSLGPLPPACPGR